MRDAPDGSRPRIVLLTGDEREHRFVANRLDEEIGLDAVIVDLGRPSTRKERVGYLRSKYRLPELVSRAMMRILAALARDNARRDAQLRDVLGSASDAFGKREQTTYVRGINSPAGRAAVEAARPDYLLVYGTGIVGSKVLAKAERLAMNLHTGMSPDYRGSDCAFWPVRNRDYELVGATVHECTARVDGGEIYRRAAARLEPGDGEFAVFARCVDIGADLYIEAVGAALSGELVGTPQDLSVGREYRAVDKGLRDDLTVRWRFLSGGVRRDLRERRTASRQTIRVSDRPALSVTIVNHRARDLLRMCLQSLRDHPYTLGPLEVVVLDNASEDGSLEMLAAEFPDVVVLAETVRRGYGANQNRAIDAASGELVLMLNPDAVVHRDTLDGLVAALIETGATMAGGPIANADGSWRQESPHPFPTPKASLAKAVGMGHLGRATVSDAAFIADGWPSGGACLVVRSAFRDVGGFDEQFFMYSEDADLFARLSDAGHQLVWVPGAVVTHPYPDETVELSSRREAEILRAELRYMRKHHGRAGSILYRTGVGMDASLRVVVFSLPGLSRFARLHGKSAAHNRRVHLARLAAVVGAGGDGLSELADAWNKKHAAPSGTVLDRLVVFDASTAWDSPWMAFQHIANHLSQRATVLFVDAPESPVYALRNRHRLFVRSSLVQVGTNLHRLTPAAPPGLTRPVIHHFTSWSVRRAVASAVDRLGLEVHATLASLSHANIFGVAPDAVKVYYASDDFEAGAALMGRPPDRLAALDAELAAEADVIVAISPTIADRYAARGYDPVLVPNGVEVDAFSSVDEAPVPPDVTLEGPIAGYVGQIGDRIDLALLEAVADAGTALLLVGPRQPTYSETERFDRLVGRSNVQWVGTKPFSELPSYLRIMDVGLVPYTNSDFNRASFPLKTLEYLAAGRSVVATPLPAVLWLETDLIVLAETPETYAAAVRKAMGAERSADQVAERRRFASAHSWGSRVDQLAVVLGLEEPPVDPR